MKVHYDVMKTCHDIIGICHDVMGTCYDMMRVGYDLIIMYYTMKFLASFRNLGLWYTSYDKDALAQSAGTAECTASL